ncbi:hypothetical protein HY256_04690 [Candidatus Sumerlaeota bacterium]|nr:hypothetical protein [Candidatus Sumerlaeota bacterium]
MLPDPITEPKRCLTLLLCAGAVVCAIAYSIAASFGVEGHPMPILRDVFIFQQYARALAEGHPYQFNAGDLPSTGSTSHLYPALLAVFYFIGAKGAALSTAGFLLCAACYLSFLFSFWHAARKISPADAPLAAGLCVLSGQTFITSFDQMEMALFMALAMGAFAAVLHARWRLAALLLALSCWTRPEGMILSFFLFATGAPSPWRRQAGSARLLLAGVIGLLSFGGVMLFNKALTGTMTFHSVLGKGDDKFYPLVGRIEQGALALGSMTREILFGLSEVNRQFYLLPVVGGLLGITGFLSRDWKTGETARAEAWWGLASLAAVGIIATSGWQGVQYDRYITWFFPVWFIYVAIGARRWAEKLAADGLYAVLAAGLLIYQLVGFGFLAAGYTGGAARVASNVAFYRSVDQMLPDGSRIGVISGSGMAYWMPKKPVRNICGIVTPEFTHPYPVFTNIELLKHHRIMRFDYWLLPASTGPGYWIWPTVGGQVSAEAPALGGINTQALYKSDWGGLEAALELQDPEIARGVANLELVDQLDIGYMEDELRTGYNGFARIAGAEFHPFVDRKRLGTGSAVEVGRLILGTENFRVRCKPGKTMRVVLRTSLATTLPIYKPTQEIDSQDFQFGSPLRLNVSVDGKDLPPVVMNLPPAPDQFDEFAFDIPGAAFTRESAEFVVGGDHISYGYWFYQ